MKYIFLLLCAFMTVNSFSQLANVKKRPTVFGSVSSFDFKIADDDRLRGFKDNYSGIGVGFWQGLTNKLDLSISLNASKVFYPFTNGLNYRTRRNLYELDFALNLKLLNDDHVIVPYLTAGIGGYVFATTNGSYAPLGSGLQFNISDKVFILTSIQYRLPVSSEAKPHAFYGLSVGIPVTGRKVAEPTVVINRPAAVSSTRPVTASSTVSPIVYDRDKDGVPDSIDRCPTTPGIASQFGCPTPLDTDGDGVVDSLDKCPTVAGVESTGGCPLADQDNDSIPDVVDLCPTVPGLQKYNGCPIPDTDGDGMNDEVDKCPDQPGPANNGGCPTADSTTKSPPSAAAEKQAIPDTTGKQLLSYDIYFYSGLTIVPDASQKILLGVVDILFKNPSAKAVIWGYSDNIEFGTAATAKANSTKRALAIASYLINRGISKSRITTIGLGIANPKVSNSTQVGRSQNRRVEIKIVE